MMCDDERNAERGSAGSSTNPSAFNPEMRSLFREFFSEFSRSGLVMDRPRDSSIDAGLTRQINALAPHKDGDDISKYIRKLEADLRDIGCPRRRWKTILLQKLQSKTASCIVDGLDCDGTDYDQLKDILMEALGSSLTSLGIKLTSDFAGSTRSMNPLETYVHLKSIMDSVDMLCRSKDELLLFFACATYRASRPVAQRALMDQREFTSFRDLNKFALSIYLILIGPLIVVVVIIGLVVIVLLSVLNATNLGIFGPLSVEVKCLIVVVATVSMCQAVLVVSHLVLSVLPTMSPAINRQTARPKGVMMLATLILDQSIAERLE